jgi:hypothetical protein
MNGMYSECRCSTCGTECRVEYEGADRMPIPNASTSIPSPENLQVLRHCRDGEVLLNSIYRVVRFQAKDLEGQWVDTEPHTDLF